MRVELLKKCVLYLHLSTKQCFDMVLEFPMLLTGVYLTCRKGVGLCTRRKRESHGVLLVLVLFVSSYFVMLRLITFSLDVEKLDTLHAKPSGIRSALPLVVWGCVAVMLLIACEKLMPLIIIIIMG